MPADETTLPTDVAELHKMIGDLRKEAGDRRVQHKPYAEAFDGYNENEVKYLLDLVKTTAADPKAGAVKFRDMAKNVLQDEFYTGLDDLPTSTEEAKKDEQSKGETKDSPTEEENQAMTPEQMQKILDEREAKAKQDAEVQAIYAEIEALGEGFEKGSPAFMMILQQATATNNPNFSELAPKVRAFHELPEPKAEGEATTTDGTEDEAKAEETEAPTFPSTVGAGGAGAPAESKGDWIAEAKAAGVSPLAAARERAAQKLGAA